MKNIAVIMVAMLAMVRASMAAFYADAINVNYGTVTGTQPTPQTPSGPLAESWNNITAIGPGGPQQGGVYLAPVWTSVPVTAMGAAAPTNFMCNVQNGGWGTVTMGAGGGQVGTLMETVANNNSHDDKGFGNPDHFNWYVQWVNMPASFTNTGYDVYALNDGNWAMVATNVVSTNGSTLPHLVVATTAAIQFLKIGTPSGMLMLLR